MNEDDVSTIKGGVKKVLQELYDRDGKTKAAALVEAATPQDSPAHAGFEWDFEWDDEKAGHEHRRGAAWRGEAGQATNNHEVRDERTTRSQ